jgi:hypothetical protein
MTRQNSLRYIAKPSPNMRYISQIFQKDNRGVFTADSSMAHYMLRYFIASKTQDVKPFRLRELQHWLVQHNKEIQIYYSDKDSSKHTTISNRIHGFERQINRVFEDLIQMDLIRQESLAPAEKIKDKQVKLYVFTKYGELLALIIHIMDLKNELLIEKDNNKIQTKTKELRVNNQYIYELMMSMLTVGENFTYQAVFLRKYLTRLQYKEIFDKFIDGINKVCNSDTRNFGIISLVGYALEYLLNDAPDRNQFLDLWYESANELDPEGRNIFLYKRKLEIEENFRNNSIKGYSKEYERQWFANRKNYDKIVLEGECHNCKESNIIILTHDEYRTLIRNIGSWNIKVGNIRKFDCQYCQSKNSCSLTTF